MQIRETRQGDVLVLAPDAAITASEDTNALDLKIASALKAGTKQVVLDCASVSQLGSAAVRILLTTSRRLERTGGRLVLCEMNPKLRKAFAISGVEKDFAVCGTRDEAMVRAAEPVPIAPPRPKVERKPAPAAEPPPEPVAVESSAPASAPVEPAPPMAAAVETPAPAPTPAKPAIDPRHALAASLLTALGLTNIASTADRAEGVQPQPRADLDSLAAGLLTALRVRVS